MKATIEEKQLIEKLSACRFLPGSFEKKFVRDLNLDNISALQHWWIYKLGFKYRKQIGDQISEVMCRGFIHANPEPPMSRKESEKILRKINKYRPELPLGIINTNQLGLF
jgi:hypothetical protein